MDEGYNPTFSTASSVLEVDFHETANSSTSYVDDTTSAFPSFPLPPMGSASSYSEENVRPSLSSAIAAKANSKEGIKLKRKRTDSGKTILIENDENPHLKHLDRVLKIPTPLSVSDILAHNNKNNIKRGGAPKKKNIIT